MSKKAGVPITLIHRKARALVIQKDKESLVPMSRSALLDEYFNIFWSIFWKVLQAGYPIKAKGFFEIKVKVNDDYKHSKDGWSVRGYVKFSQKFKGQVIKFKKGGDTSLPLVVQEITKGREKKDACNRRKEL